MEKNIRLKGKGWSIRAIAINIPSYDVAISLKVSKVLTQEEVPAEELKFKKMIVEWFEDSKLNPNHFILSVTTPSGYKYNRGAHSMMFLADISVCTRKVIERGSNTFEDVFMEELERLVESLDLAS